MDKTLHGFLFNKVDLYRIDESGKEEVDIPEVLVLIPNELKPSDQELMNKILSSVNISEAEILTLTPGHRTDNILAKQKNKVIISFGYHMQHSIQGTDSAIEYQIFERDNKVLLASELSTLSENIDLKRKLWEALKLLFEI